MKFYVIVAIFCGALAAVKQCDMPTRPVVCPEIYGPVCGTKTDGTQQTYDNYCLACADGEVESYKEGSSCKGETVKIPSLFPRPVQPPATTDSGYTYCHDPRPQICTKQFNPVCGIKKVGEPRTYGNGCGACGDKNVVAWVLGDCGSQVNVCTGNEIDCSLVRIAQNPSCGFKHGAPYADTSNSVCCIGTPYSQIIRMKCPTAPATLGDSSFVKCGPHRKGIMCVMIYKPVCALLKDGTHRTEGNSCTACTSMNVVGYTEGECQSDLHPIDQIPPTPVVYPLPPILIADPLPPTTEGKFTMCPDGPRQRACNKMLLETCGFKYKGLPQDYGNTCTACSDANVFGYIVGRCPDVVKTCPKDRLDCRLIKAPYVQSCAFEEGKAPYNVSNNLCCQDSNYDQVIQGMCPVIRQSSLKTVCPTRRSEFCPRIYKPVCGATKSRTRKTYPNGCEACADRRVKFYVDGKC